MSADFRHLTLVCGDGSHGARQARDADSKLLQCGGYSGSHRVIIGRFCCGMESVAFEGRHPCWDVDGHTNNCGTVTGFQSSPNAFAGMTAIADEEQVLAVCCTNTTKFLELNSKFLEFNSGAVELNSEKLELNSIEPSCRTFVDVALAASMNGCVNPSSAFTSRTLLS